MLFQIINAKHILKASLAFFLTTIIAACGGGGGSGGGGGNNNGGGGNSGGGGNGGSGGASNQEPTANAGNDLLQLVSELVTLNGTSSSDSDGDSLTYSWNQIAGPNVSLDLSVPAQPTFTSPTQASTLVFELRVNDGNVDSAVDKVSVFVSTTANQTLSQDLSFGTGGFSNVDVLDDLLNDIAIRDNDDIIVAGAILDNDNAAFYSLPANGNQSSGVLAGIQKDFGMRLQSFEAMAIDASGRTVVAGFAFLEEVPLNPDRYVCLVARYNNGSLDNTFNGQGFIAFDFFVAGNNGRSSDFCNAVAIQEDGKIVVAGTSTFMTGQDMALARLNSDGSFDTSFGDDGIAINDLGDSTSISHEEIYNILIQDNGSIIVTGDLGVGGEIQLARYSAAGELDTSLGDNGIINVEVGTTVNLLNAMAAQADGKVLVARSVDSQMVVARFNEDLSTDTSFGTNGIASASFIDGVVVHDMTVNVDGKILLVGGTATFPGDFAIAQFLPNGILENNNTLEIDAAMRDDTARAVAIQSDGGFIIGGESEESNSDYDFNVFKVISQ